MRRKRPPDRDLLDELHSLLDQLPAELARQAFTHASWAESEQASYGRLAFIGDSVLSLAVATHLLPRFERHDAGRLTKLRAQVVSRPSCARVARSLGLPERLATVAPEGGAGRGAAALAANDNVLAEICEAVIGAAYLEFGFDRVAPAVADAFAGEIELAQSGPADHKSLLQERLARRAETVSYEVATEEGPPHDRSFVVVARVGDEEVGRGRGKTKKAAEQEAAEAALEREAGA